MMPIELPCKMKRLYSGASYDHSEFCVASRHVTERDMLIRLAVWARYNRRARALGRRIFIQTVGH